MHFFVTGATGFIGSNLLNTLFLNGHQVTALRSFKSKTRVKLIQEPKWCYGKLTDDFSKQISKCDSVIHLASTGVINNFENWNLCFDVNVYQSLIFLKNASRIGIKKFLIAGSCSEYGKSADKYQFLKTNSELKPIGAYGTSKAAATLSALGLARTERLKLTIARIFHTYGIGEDKNRFWPSLIKASSEDKNFQMTRGEQIRDFTPVDLVTKKLLSLALKVDLEKDNGVIKNVGSGNIMSILDFASKEWKKRNSKGKLLVGALPYRKNEIMRYVPYLEN